MDESNAGLVDIVREYLDVNERMRDLFVHFRAGTLGFGPVRDLFADDERSPLFRLKERCHRLFRRRGSNREPMWRAELFDLAVGSLFHEAMKFRENFYQQVVYAPRVRALRDGLGADHAEGEELLREFEKIQTAAEARMDEALQETEALLAHTGDQLWVLLSGTLDGLITRYLLEQRQRVDPIHPVGLDHLLAEMHGDLAHAHAAAARSYLESAHFGHALAAFEAAGEEAEDVSRLVGYARGMQSFQAGEYAVSLDQLGGWLDAGVGAGDAPHVALAHSAVAHIDRLVKDDALVARADAVASRLAEVAAGQLVAGDSAPLLLRERK